jgi:hypothetical protein
VFGRLDEYRLVFDTFRYQDTEEDPMATNCVSEDMPPRRSSREEVLGWVNNALRSERLLAALRAKEQDTEA